MNGAHFHLLVNHLPFFFPLIGLLVLLLGMIFRNAFSQRVAFFLFVIGAIATFLAMGSGEEAEEIAESIGGSHGFIHVHEEKAEIFALLNYCLGVISIVGIWYSWKQKRWSSYICALSIVFASIVVYFSFEVGSTGGEIMHKEIRKGFVSKGEVEQKEDKD